MTIDKNPVPTRSTSLETFATLIAEVERLRVKLEQERAQGRVDVRTVLRFAYLRGAAEEWQHYTAGLPKNKLATDDAIERGDHRKEEP